MDNKHCNLCNLILPKENFSPNKSKKDGLQTSCKLCRQTEQKERYKTRKEYHKNRNRIIKNNLKEKFRKIKQVPCKDCGRSYPYYVMDFDHLGNKEFMISKFLSISWERVLEEIKKCDIVCANCHRERTFGIKNI